jgi:hypothetical protein
MNTKQLVAKSLLVTLLVAFATLISAGSVAADHITGAPGAIDIRMSRLDAFGQYLAAIEMTEEHRFETVAVDSVDYRMSRLDRFGQYLAALEMTAEERVAAVGESDHSGIRFEQYLWAIEQ